MTTDQIIELAIQGHASKRDAIKWAIEQERGQCAKVCDKWEDALGKYYTKGLTALCAEAIRARGES